MATRHLTRRINPTTGLANGIKNLIGQQFGRLTVIAFSHSDERAMWVCRCECGNEKLVASKLLTAGQTKSCGCLRGTHHQAAAGSARPRVYRIWQAMLNRCRNPNVQNYARYGGRGIRVCERWMSFENFFADMSDPPSPSHSIDRIEGDGDYEPGNCRWATEKEQQANRRCNRYVTHDGATRTLKEWSQLLGGSENIVSIRLRNGWTELAAVTTPIHGR
jgi:hypothetical protein